MAALCTICHDFLIDDTEDSSSPADPVALKCGHLFHYVCIFRWFDSNGGVGKDNVKCPTCNHTNGIYDILKIYPASDDSLQKLEDLELKVKEQAEQLKILESQFRKENEDHAILKVKYQCLVDKVGRELEKIGKGSMKSEADVALLKISNIFNSRDGAANEYNEVDDNGDAVLAYAIMRKRPVDKLYNLVRNGANWKHLNNNGQNMLHIAASSGTPAALKYFLELGELEVNGLDLQWRTPLYLALERERKGGALVEKCKLLIGKGAAVGIMDKTGMTPFMIAVQHRDKLVQDKLMKVMLDEPTCWRMKDEIETEERTNEALPLVTLGECETATKTGKNAKRKCKERVRNGSRQKLPPEEVDIDINIVEHFESLGLSDQG